MTTLVVKGRPAPKGSRQYFGNGRSKPMSRYEADWTEAVAGCVIQPVQTMAPPYAVVILFYIARPAKPKYGWPVQSDLDKLERCTLDGLVKGGLIEDDCHVITLSSSKTFAGLAESGAVISVKSLADVM